MFYLNYIRQLFVPTGLANKKHLSKRSVFMGWQAGYTLAILNQPVIMFLTSQTAIARFGVEYGMPAYLFGILILLITFLLGIDFFYCLSDYRTGTHYTTTPFAKFIAKNRGYLFFWTTVWSLMLMTTVKVELGAGTLFAYGLLFLGNAGSGLYLALRDGCIENYIQCQDRKHEQLRKETTVCIHG